MGLNAILAIYIRGDRPRKATKGKRKEKEKEEGKKGKKEKLFHRGTQRTTKLHKG